ncbi:hypothetical protein CspeluHIS016_0103720 [Cutaneotrichosporon spelunceum]|uniref:E3 ubiquitin-protein ligase PEP5 n=1 Tax=Cutaneotrichosporon spelunceum TaxID=1672016 RepID=A0AAD3TMS6_9TREE|nr:hypothetical protein CspeluHIS016_0103720 [Cutaneotrichosporon spelunceum]
MAGPSRAPDASAPQWRQFTFFDLDNVKDADDLASSPRAVKELSPPVVATPTSPDSPLPPSLIVSSGNTVTVFDRHFVPERSFQAWEGSGRATALVEAGGLLLAVGEDEGSRQPVLKVWDLTRGEKRRRGDPLLMRNVKIQQTAGRPHPVSAVALTTNLSHLAIGLGDGTVLLYRHLLQSLTTSPMALTTLPKARTVVEANDRTPEAITGLGFREGRLEKGGVTATTLFITTTSRVLCAPVSTRGGEARVLHESGAGLGCAEMDAERQELVVARDDAIYRYSPEGRGASYAFEGPKSSIAIVKHNLIITSPPIHAGRRIKGEDAAKITIFDLDNKLVAYTGVFRNGIRALFSQWGNIYVLEGKGEVSRLEEHSTSAKLDVLYRRNLFVLALSLAQTQNVNDAGVAEIHRLYGDYLYGKGDFDGAMSQFTKTLGFVQPSYVIRKFLDAQRMNNLTMYLQELHARGLANPDHTTLLLNCYTKSGNSASLDQFIKAEATRDIDTLPFELETAIRVCRQAGFFEHATYLARKYGRHEEYLRIQIEDAEEYKDALEYLRSLGPQACEENLVRYGRALLQHEPTATTELLIDLCSGTLGRKKAHANIHQSLEDARANVTGLTSYLPAMPTLGVNRLWGEGQTPAPNGANGALTPADGHAKEEEDAPAYTPPSPRLFFAHFVDHRDLFVHFLEDVAYALWNQRVEPALTPGRVAQQRGIEDTVDLPRDEADQRAVWNTLLELYLDSTRGEGDLATTARGKVLGLLASPSIPYDPMHALVLCSMAEFTEGLVGLWESLGMYEDVLRYWMERDAAVAKGRADEKGVNAADEVKRYLDMYGPGNPSLYPMVLRYITSSGAVLSRHKDSLPHILETIDAERIIPPLAVVQLLSRNGVASVGTVKDWLRAKVEETRQEIDADKALVESYRSETAAKEKEIADLTNTRQPEVFQVTQCAACGGQLDLPAVHFMCKHSYHQRCLSDSDPECILCAQQHAMVRELRNNQARLADRHDLFLGEVHDADDPFAVVAGAFSRGLFQKEVPQEV